MKKIFPLKKSEKGFTLLEVMIAISIMVLAFSVILTTQSANIDRTIRSKEMNLAGWLAQSKMAESEILMEGKPFAELKKEEGPTAFGLPNERFSWKREVKEVAFPDFTIPGKKDQGIPEPLRILSQVLSKFFRESVRELVVTITWQRGTGDQTLAVSTYLVNLNAEIDFTP